MHSIHKLFLLHQIFTRFSDNNKTHLEHPSNYIAARQQPLSSISCIFHYVKEIRYQIMLPFFAFVLQVRARAQVEKIRASLFNSSDLIGLSNLEREEELMEMTNEEILTASSVNQSLFDTQGSSVLEEYFLDKSIRGWLISLSQNVNNVILICDSSCKGLL